MFFQGHKYVWALPQIHFSKNCYGRFKLTWAQRNKNNEKKSQIIMPAG